MLRNPQTNNIPKAMPPMAEPTTAPIRALFGNPIDASTINQMPRERVLLETAVVLLESVVVMFSCFIAWISSCPPRAVYSKLISWLRRARQRFL